MTETPSEKLKTRWLAAVLPRVEDQGWTRQTLSAAAEDIDLTDGEQALAAPNGVNDLIDHYFQLAGDRLLEHLADQDLDAMKVHERVAAGLRAFLDVMENDRAAIKRAAARGMMPWGAKSALGRVWSIADTIWEAAGDTATDYNRYTKRSLLSAAIPPIILYWLDEHKTDEQVDAFIMARLKNVMRIGQTGGKLAAPILDRVWAFKERRSNQA